MANTLRIELIAPAAQVAANLKQVAGAMNQVATAQGRLGGGSRSAPGAVGPFTRLHSLNNQLGIPNTMSLAQAQHANMALAHQRAQAQVNRANGVPAPFAQRLNTFVRSTRFGGSGVMPLVGRSADLLGVGSGGGASAAFAAAAAAIVGLAVAAKQARDTLTTLAGINNVAGGGIGSAGQASRIGAAIGLSGSQIGGMARSTIEGISNGGPGAAYANGYGVRAVPGMGDPSNKLDRFIRLISGIANDPNEERARRAAQSLGMEDFLNLRNLSPETRSKVLGRMKGGADKRDVQAAAEFNAQIGLIGDSFSRIVTKIGTPVLRVAAVALEKVADAFDYLAKNADMVGAVILGPLIQLAELLTGRKASATSGQGKSPVDRNTDAINENTRALNNSREFFGNGGPNSRGAAPQAWRSKEFFDRYAKGQARAMGAFSW